MQKEITKTDHIEKRSKSSLKLSKKKFVKKDSHIGIKGTVMQTKKVLIYDCLRV